ncbi:MAG: recombination regulator RecX [Betaproteobacteria bacterium]
MPVPPPSLKGRVLRLLSTREYSRIELERKLRRHETEPGELAGVLDGLQAKGFIDDKRVIESVIHRRAAKLGAGRICQELHDKGLPADAIRAAVAGLQASELQRAGAVWRKKFAATLPGGGGEPNPARATAERARQIRFLAARGFGGDTIRRVVSGAGDCTDGEESA